MQVTKYFLDYAATYPNAKVIYQASDMIIVDLHFRDFIEISLFEFFILIVEINFI